MVEVVGTSEFEEWFLGLSSVDARAVVRGVGLLEGAGIRLGFPHCSALGGSRYALRELRVQSSGRPLRIVYAFDHCGKPSCSWVATRRGTTGSTHGSSRRRKRSGSGICKI